MTQNERLCDRAYRAEDQMATWFEVLIGASRYSAYILEQSSSLVSDATVRIALAASQAGGTDQGQMRPVFKRTR